MNTYTFTKMMDDTPFHLADLESILQAKEGGGGNGGLRGADNDEDLDDAAPAMPQLKRAFTDDIQSTSAINDFRIRRPASLMPVSEMDHEDLQPLKSTLVTPDKVQRSRSPGSLKPRRGLMRATRSVRNMFSNRSARFSSMTGGGSKKGSSSEKQEGVGASLPAKDARKPSMGKTNAVPSTPNSVRKRQLFPTRPSVKAFRRMSRRSSLSNIVGSGGSVSSRSNRSTKEAAPASMRSLRSSNASPSSKTSDGKPARKGTPSSILPRAAPANVVKVPSIPRAASMQPIVDRTMHKGRSKRLLIDTARSPPTKRLSKFPTRMAESPPPSRPTVPLRFDTEKDRYDMSGTSSMAWKSPTPFLSPCKSTIAALPDIPLAPPLVRAETDGACTMAPRWESVSSVSSYSSGSTDEPRNDLKGVVLTVISNTSQLNRQQSLATTHTNDTLKHENKAGTMYLSRSMSMKHPNEWKGRQADHGGKNKQDRAPLLPTRSIY